MGTKHLSTLVGRAGVGAASCDPKSPWAKVSDAASAARPMAGSSQGAWTCRRRALNTQVVRGSRGRARSEPSRAGHRQKAAACTPETRVLPRVPGSGPWSRPESSQDHGGGARRKSPHRDEKQKPQLGDARERQQALRSASSASLTGQHPRAVSSPCCSPRRPAVSARHPQGCCARRHPPRPSGPGRRQLCFPSAAACRGLCPGPRCPGGKAGAAGVWGASGSPG